MSDNLNRFCCALCVLPILLICSNAPAASGDDPGAKLGAALLHRLATEPGPAKAWVFFADKGCNTPVDLEAALQQVEQDYNKRALWRRQMRADNARRGGRIVDEHDIPVVQAYIDGVEATGARRHVTSRWLNAISVYATQAQAETIAALPFVDRLEAVGRSRHLKPVSTATVKEEPKADAARGLDYGLSLAQLEQINLVNLHNEGYTGQGVIVGILDTGFERSHEAFNQLGHEVTILAEYDFVDDDPDTSQEAGDPSSQHYHGTLILGCLGSYKSGSLIGGAFDASFVLAKTEDTTGEYPAEEDNFVAGLEFLEENGVDMATSSLGYIDWYTQEDLDGETAVTTIAINIFTGNGAHHCNAAGNEYHDSDPTTSSLIAPSDGFQVITCGAVSSSGEIAGFSSDGPTADGRVKPELCARGSSTHTVDPYSSTGYSTASGTSLSTPLVACAVACLTQARPYWTVDQMREHMFETASYYVEHGEFDPLYVYGYGVVDAYAANDVCDDAGVVTLDSPKYACEDSVSIMVNDCGLDLDPFGIDTVNVAIDSDAETGVEQVTLTELAPDAATFTGTIAVSTTDSPGVLWVAEGDTITVTYVDEDDGAGGTDVIVTDTAVVDCTPPVISDVQTATVGPFSATITFQTDEPTRGSVHYGVSCDALTETATASGYTTMNAVSLSGLAENATYFYSVEAEDEAGNTAVDDNDGNCYMFSTPDIPAYFTEEFGSGFDLQWQRLTFTPNESFDFYAACVEPIEALPTDPAGGTTISLSDDDYQSVSVSGGQVSFYGESYSSLYVSSNGYVTFDAGDSDYSESIDDHFDQVRISALFDDLNPSTGGTVSYKSLLNRFVVTFDEVPEYSAEGANTFQIELFFNGVITISYTDVSCQDAIVGLSQGGGVPEGFVAMDLSALGACLTLGDLNCSGIVDFFDISAFVLAITDPTAYAAQYPDCDIMNGDCNGDGEVNFFDIDAFVELITGS